MTDSAIRTILAVLVMLAFISTSACSSTSFKEIKRTPESISKYIKPGDVVKVTATSGYEQVFQVDEINSQYIIGSNNKKILLNEIDTIEKKQKNRSGFYYILIGLEAAATVLPSF